MSVRSGIARRFLVGALSLAVVGGACVPQVATAAPTTATDVPPTKFTDDGSDSYKVTAQDAQDSGMTVAELQALYDEETSYLGEDDAAFQGTLKKTGLSPQAAADQAGADVPDLTQADKDAEQALLNAPDPADDDVWEDSTKVASGSGGGVGGGYNGGDVAVLIKPTPGKVTPPHVTLVTPNSGAGSGGGYKCLPTTGDYCWHGQKYMKYGRGALAYANSHTGYLQRYPVPFPTTYGGRLRNRNHTVYVVRYIDWSGNAKTWKFGITSLPDYRTRAKVGKFYCNLQVPSVINGTGDGKPGSCYYTWIGVTAQDNGWRRGRYLEASLILWYSRKGGGNIGKYLHVCPPGQAASCR